MMWGQDVCGMQMHLLHSSVGCTADLVEAVRLEHLSHDAFVQQHQLQCRHPRYVCASQVIAVQLLECCMAPCDSSSLQ
jgi:hypothetical protein